MKIGKYRIIEEMEYKDLKESERKWDERELILRDNQIQNQKQKLQKKYKKYLKKYFLHKDEGFIFQIIDITYTSNSYDFDDCNFMFSCRIPNGDNGFDIDITEITEKEHIEVKKGDIY